MDRHHKDDIPQTLLPENLKWLDEEFLSLQWLQDTLRAAERLPSSKRKSDLIKHLSNVQQDQTYPDDLVSMSQKALVACADLKQAKERIDVLELENAKWMKILLKHNLITTPESFLAHKSNDDKRKTIFWFLVIGAAIITFIVRFVVPAFQIDK